MGVAVFVREVLAIFGEIPLETPRDRNGRYEPKIISKGQTRFTGFDDKIISMYARGMSTREIQGHLEDIYKVEVSLALISNVTEAVLEEVKNWQSRPLDAVYPIVYLDGLLVKIREAGHVRNKAIYVAIGVNMQGNKEVLGLWKRQATGAKFSRTPGIPAPESALGLRLRSALPYAQVRSVYQGCVIKAWPFTQKT
jgi:putative transposase